MKEYINDNFLLKSEAARKLYFNYAKALPIVDFHCHLDAKEIYENKQYVNIAALWLGDDHYKWRAMRSNGINEKYITGSGKDFEKFTAWARTIPYAIGNPLYHWTHLELKRYFGIDEILNENSAKAIWEKVNELLRSGEFSARQIIKKSKVEVICTTDDPLSSLEYHIKVKNIEDFDTVLLPTFRPDKALGIEKSEFTEWVKGLEDVTKTKISSYEQFLQALEERADYFNAVGCRLSDHSLELALYCEGTLDEVKSIFSRALKGEAISKEEIAKYKTYTLLHLAKLYSKHEWTMQLHIGAMRNNNKTMFDRLGPDKGFDSMNDFNIAETLSRLMDSMAAAKSLPKTILYNLNPADNGTVASMAGNFQEGPAAGKVQFGAAWWFNDHKEGMERQLKDLASLGLLGRFVGMVTDSRSFLSYTRHEYFRRILCNLFGQWMEDGEVPMDFSYIGKIVEDICYNNVKEYLKL